MPHYTISDNDGAVVLWMELSEGGTMEQPMKPHEAEQLAADLRFVAHAARQTREAAEEST